MGAMEISMFPTIDFSSDELKPGTPTWESVKSQVKSALEEFGCFHAFYDKISDETRKNMFQSLPELFDQPLQEIQQNCTNKDFKYYATAPGRPLSQGIGIAGLKVPEMVNSFTNIIWPHGNSSFRDTMQCYSEPIGELNKTIRIMILESLGLEKYMEEHMDSVELYNAFNKYAVPENNGSDDEIALSVHTDKNILTVLDENGVSGLEILQKDGEFVKVDFFPNTFFVLIGDFIHAWTNGRLHQPRHHRVTMRGNKIRYTTGFFSTYKRDYVVKAPEELIDENHPQIYNPFEVSKATDFYSRSGKYSHTLKEYCGI